MHIITNTLFPVICYLFTMQHDTLYAVETSICYIYVFIRHSVSDGNPTIVHAVVW